MNISTLEKTLIYLDHPENNGIDINQNGNLVVSHGRFWNGPYIAYHDANGTALKKMYPPFNEGGHGSISVNDLDQWILTDIQIYNGGRTNNIQKIDPDGNSWMNLTHEVWPNLIKNFGACWTTEPNEGFITFTTDYYGNNEIVLMKADGHSYPPGMINLTNHPADDKNGDYTPTEFNNAPVAVCADIRRPADLNCLASILPSDMDGGSYDPDGDSLSLSIDPPGPFALGEHLVKLIVTDDKGASSECYAQVAVIDETPPEIVNAAASPNELKPPNHKMIPVVISVAAFDNCSHQLESKIIGVVSSEPEDGLGDGDASPDWEITGPLTVNLRAERSGKGKGRIYTISVQCADAAGNHATANIQVKVPKGQ